MDKDLTLKTFYKDGKPEHVVPRVAIMNEAAGKEQILKHGLSKKYYKTGQVQEEVQYKMNKMAGDWKMWFVNGQLEFSIVMDKGKKNGAYNRYHPNGQLKLQGAYKDDQRCGLFRRWEADGTVVFEGYFWLNKEVSKEEYYRHAV